MYGLFHRQEGDIYSGLGEDTTIPAEDCSSQDDKGRVTEGISQENNENTRQDKKHGPNPRQRHRAEPKSGECAEASRQQRVFDAETDDVGGSQEK